MNAKSRRPLLPFLFVAAALLAATGVGIVNQRGETAALQAELELARLERAELNALRADHARLQAQQLPPADLMRLRDDRAALQRLQSELATLQTQPSRQN